MSSPASPTPETPQRLRSARFAHSALTVASVFSLVAVLALRLYAAWELPAVRTPWDDDFYRAAAGAAAASQSNWLTVYNLVLPHGGLVIDGRLNGYNDWLAAGLEVNRAFGLGSREVAFQTVNTFMLILQAVVLLLFASWALRDRAQAAAIAFLFVAAPMVFGTSRWVHTENLVFLAGLTLSALTAWLLEPRRSLLRQARWGNLLRVAAAAWVIGLCAKAREYAAPSFIVLVSVTLAVLLMRKRWRELAVLTAVTGAFLVPWTPALIEALKVTLGKGGESQYFHTIAEWVPHVAFYTIGPSLSVVLVGLGAAVVYHRVRSQAPLQPSFAVAPVRRLRGELSGIRPLVWAHLFLVLFYVAFLVWSRNRITRPAVPIMLAGLGLVLTGARTLPRLRAWLHGNAAKAVMLALVVASWSVLSYQLVFAFEGGKVYAHHGFRLEYFNYPLRLRLLKDASDSYVCVDRCIYDKP